jgi:hypothetical protein
MKTKKRFKDNIAVYYGDEPSLDRGFLTVDSFKTEFGHALNWYNMASTPEKLKSYALTYLKANGSPKTEIAKFERVDESEFRVVGALCRMFNKGMTPPESEELDLRSKIDNFFSKMTVPQSSKKGDEKSKYDKIQEGMNNKRRAYIGAIEEVIDTFLLTWKPGFSMKAWLFERSVPKAYAVLIRERYAPLYEELMEAIAGDEYYKEAYSNFTRARLCAFRDFVSSIISDCNAYTSTVSKIRKPRKMKEKDPEKVTKKVKFQAGIPELKIVSVNPDKIVKASQVWLFNTTYRNLTVLNAKDGGFVVRGTSIFNFDETTSMKKKIRKPEVTLPSIVVAGKVALRKFMDNIKCRPQPAKGRLGEDTVIVRVV